MTNWIGEFTMTKEEVVKLLILIESVYSNCIFKDETVLQWFELYAEMDFEKVMANLKNHIRKTPYPPAIADIAVFTNQERLLEHNNAKRTAALDWLEEYSTRKSI